MKTRTSIRLRLTAWYASVLALCLIVFGGGLWFALRHRLTQDLDRRLTERVEGLRTVLDLETQVNANADLRLELSEFAREVPEGDLMLVRDGRGQTLLAAPDIRLFDAPRIPAGLSTLRRAGTEYRVISAGIVVRQENYQVLVAASTRDIHVTMAVFRTLLVLLIPFTLITACGVGFWISSRALKPVSDITAEARSISVHNLSHRLTVLDTGDELQHLAETWNEMLDRLENSVRRIRQFTADASHELRTPLALIRGTTDLTLRRDRSVEEYREALAAVRDEADRMTELSESLLTLARADAGGLRLALSPVDLASIVDGVVNEVKPLAEAKGLALAAQAETTGTLAAANESAVRRLLLALIDNAIKYTTRGSVTVELTGGLALAVRDTGPGIEAEALPHIFERFYRADSVRRAGEGAGLGLAIAQAIAEAHGTSITVETTPGAGSTFRVVFPAA